MRKYSLTLALCFGLGLAAVAALPGWAAEKADNAKIAKLVKQLGSANFEERENATKELDAIGVPALEALKKAAKSEDAETQRRAEELVQKIQKIAESQRVLEATKVKLSFKDTLVKDAVAELAKQSKYTINLLDPENKLAERKVTLDTGETTFWEAFDSLCKKADLVEATWQDLNKPVGPGGGPIQIQPFPAPGGALPPAAGGGGTLPVAPPGKGVPVPLPPEQAPQAGATEAGAGVAGVAKVGVAVAALPVVAAPVPPGAPVGGPAVLPIRRPPVYVQPGVMTLMDGKPQNLPTSYTGAIRVRALPPGAPAVGLPAKAEELTVMLEISPEPKIQWVNAGAVRIDKAIDDLGQTLAMCAEEANGPVGVATIAIGAPGGGVAAPMMRIMPGGMRGGVSQQLPVRVKKGEKVAKTLKELKGVISASVRTPVEALITVDDVLKASGKTVQGEFGGELTIVEVTKGDGEVKLKVELEFSNDLMPANGNNMGGWGGGIGGGPAPVPLPAPLPINRKAPLAPPAAPGGAPAIAPAVPPVPPGGAVVGGPVVVGPAVGPGVAVWNGPIDGLTVVDEKGNPLPTTASGPPVYQPNGKGGLKRTWSLVVKTEKDKGEPAKLIFNGTRAVTVEVPFNLKDVPVQ